MEAFLNIKNNQGQKLGDIKPAILDSMMGLSEYFQGSFV